MECAVSSKHQMAVRAVFGARLQACNLASALQHAAQVIVATGFIAKNQSGQVTTLKRNGSDYSATIMGALVRSSNIVIWTDVDGVFSADPRKVCPAPANPHTRKSPRHVAQ